MRAADDNCDINTHNTEIGSFLISFCSHFEEEEDEEKLQQPSCSQREDRCSSSDQH